MSARLGEFIGGNGLSVAIIDYHLSSLPSAVVMVFSMVQAMVVTVGQSRTQTVAASEQEVEASREQAAYMTQDVRHQ